MIVQPLKKSTSWRAKIDMAYKWLGIFFCIQIITWLITGLLMLSGVKFSNSLQPITFFILAALTLLTLFILLILAIKIKHDKNSVSTAKISITTNSSIDKRIFVNTKQSLLHALNTQNIILPSGCGGKGTCSQCKVLIKHSQDTINEQEKVTLTSHELTQGYRLACQHLVRNDLNIQIPNSEKPF